MTASPIRRWFRFSLRTMFVLVTIFGIGLGWLVRQSQIVRERKQIVEAVQNGQGYILGTSDSALGTFREWLGDRPQKVFYLPKDRFSHDDAKRISTAFPEAKVHRMSKDEMFDVRQYYPGVTNRLPNNSP